MTSQELYKLIEQEILPPCKEIMQTKGTSYSGTEDKLGNFKRIAKVTNLPVETICFVYMAKHWDAICSYIRKEYSDSEKISSRIMDIINYCFLLYAILKEQKQL